MLSAIFLITNIHCPSCVSFIQDVLSTTHGLLAPVQVSLIRQTVRVTFDEAVTDVSTIISSLAQSAFDIQHVTVTDPKGRQVLDHDLTSTSLPRYSLSRGRSKQMHVDNCEACQKEKGLIKPFGSKSRVWSTVMGLRKTSSSHSDDIIQVDIRDAPRDRPFVLSVDGPNSPSSQDIYKATVAIEGMTCSVCVGAITQAVSDVPNVDVISVNLISNSGVFRVSGRANVDKLLACIDDVGYGAELLSLSPTTVEAQSDEERVVDFEIKGMHCGRCPDRVASFIKTEYPDDNLVKILKQPSLRSPIIQIAYVPHGIDGLTIRTLQSTIQAVDPLLHVSIYHPPTLEDRSRQLQRAERLSILYRLVFTGIVAIPTLILGVVYMALVPEKNSTRMWFEERLWSGNATRIEWALLILTTPVMLFGADMFHRRAMKEIWHIWRPGSTFPYLKRFYRFGSMNLLISAATSVAYGSSFAVLIINAASKPSADHTMTNTYFDAVTFLTFFILLGRYLEAYSKAKTGDAVTMLGNLRPTEASLLADDRSSARKISVDELEVGDYVQVARGQSPSADGVVAQPGHFSFDESSLTGESKPVTKAEGDSVYSGTVNIGDPVVIKVTKVSGSSMLDHIIAVVREGQAKRAPIERFADILTGYFVPIITLVAITTWIIWMALGLSGSLPDKWLDKEQGGWPFWSLEFAIAVFVIACPCGIGLAAPTALFVGGGVAAKKGILVQGGGQAFQEASRVNAVVFDKTGTLTQGKMKVVNFEHHSTDVDEPTSMAIANAIESSSTHPIAQAIVDHTTGGAKLINVFDVSEIPGKGVTCKIKVQSSSGERELDAAIGNQEMIEQLGKHENDAEKQYANTDASAIDHQRLEDATYFMDQSIKRHQLQGHSIAILALRASTASTQRFRPAALFAIADPLRPESAAVVDALRARNVDVHMCTGDNPTTALAIASQLHIPATNVRSSALPQDKAAYIRSLQQPSHLADATITTNNTNAGSTRRIIAFVGDGLNDAPALSSADVSISLSSGSDIAITASSFILLNTNLTSILDLLALSRRVFLRVRLNFLWAALYNIILIPVAAGVFYSVGATEEHGGWRLSPVWAAVAMAASSVSVVMSSLALRLPEVSVREWWGKVRCW